MLDEIFSITGTGFLVIREPQGSLSWRGDYSGMRVVAVQPVGDGSKCIVLLDMPAKKEPNFGNLLCLNRDGSLEWKAELPETNDAFVSLQMIEGVLSANTWNGFHVTLNPATGKSMQWKFVK